jgi:glycosyltransferase involved in cell wall biosynthesis
MADAKLSIVIPLYNEGSSLREALYEIRRHTASIPMECEFVLVNDGSTDNTWEEICRLSRETGQVRGVRLSRNFGKEAAIAGGLLLAQGDAVIVMDGDLQHPPELIPEMVQLWREGQADIVEAVKRDRGRESMAAGFRARLFYAMMRRLTDLDLENASDFKLLDRSVVDAHNRMPERTRFFRGIVSWLGFRKVQLPFSVKGRTEGSSRWSTRQLVRLAINASTAFSSLPLHLITIMGLLTFAVSIVVGLHTLYMKFSGSAVSGFATVILLLLFIGSVLMMSLGIVGVYISRIFEEVKQRPRFIISETTGLQPPRQS